MTRVISPLSTDMLSLLSQIIIVTTGLFLSLYHCLSVSVSQEVSGRCSQSECSLGEIWADNVGWPASGLAPYGEHWQHWPWHWTPGVTLVGFQTPSLSISTITGNFTRLYGGLNILMMMMIKVVWLHESYVLLHAIQWGDTYLTKCTPGNWVSHTGHWPGSTLLPTFNYFLLGWVSQ